MLCPSMQVRGCPGCFSTERLMSTPAGEGPASRASGSPGVRPHCERQARRSRRGQALQPNGLPLRAIPSCTDLRHQANRARLCRDVTTASTARPACRTAKIHPQNLKARHADMRDDVSRQKHSKQVQQHDQKQYANDHRQHRRIAEGEVGKKQNRGDTPGVTMTGMANGVTAGWR